LAKQLNGLWQPPKPISCLKQKALQLWVGALLFFAYRSDGIDRRAAFESMTDSKIKSCCTPSRGEAASAFGSAVPKVSKADLSTGAVSIPGGKGLVGTRIAGIPNDGETPLRKVNIKPFRMSPTVVTNAQFAAFIEDTGYVTEADAFGWSFVFWSQVPERVGATQAVQGIEWWRRVEGVNWQNINGPDTQDETYHPDHPVVHVSWNDAQAYAAWTGGRLPTEAEWEHAARGGLGDVIYPWGDAEPNDVDSFPCNIWQGQFPDVNSAADGYATTAPAKSFEPNGFGLFNMAGNVWEWTNDSFKIKSLKKGVHARLAGMRGYRLSKGGSFLCHKSYCYRYRIAARSGSSPDSTTTHQGFRVVWSDVA
jgi:formylglycine-generating enzyme required for sulfatase activity